MKALWIIFAPCDSFWNWKLLGMGEHHWFWSGQGKSQHKCLLELLLQILGFVSPHKWLWGSCHFRGPFSQRAERAEVLHSVMWWCQKTSENQKKVGVCAGDWLDRGCRSSFVPEPSTEPCQATLGNEWAFFSPSYRRLPHWKSRWEIFHSFCFGFVLCDGKVALQKDESSG